MLKEYDQSKEGCLSFSSSFQPSIGLDNMAYLAA